MDILQDIDFSNINTARSLYYAVNGVARKYGLRAHTGNDGDTDEIYLILSCDRVIDHKVCSVYGNGAIFIYRDHGLVPICLPSKMCLRYDKSNPPKHHNVYAIIDGTTINLYNYNGAWRIATKHSHNAGCLIWRDVQYQAEFDRLLAKCPDFSWDKLDTDKTYSLVMASINMNPLSSHDRLYFISSQNNKTGEYCFENDIGVNSQKQVLRTNAQQFGTIYRSIHQDGFDYIWRTSSYNQLRSLLYNVPDKDNDYIRNNFKHTNCMILCALAQGEDELDEKVPILRDRIIAIKKFVNDTIAHVLDVCNGKAKANCESVRRVTEDLKDLKEDAIVNILTGLYGVEFLDKLYLSSSDIHEPNEIETELTTGDDWDC